MNTAMNPAWRKTGDCPCFLPGLFFTVLPEGEWCPERSWGEGVFFPGRDVVPTSGRESTLRKRSTSSVIQEEAQSSRQRGANKANKKKEKRKEKKQGKTCKQQKTPIEHTKNCYWFCPWCCVLSRLSVSFCRVYLFFIYRGVHYEWSDMSNQECGVWGRLTKQHGTSRMS